MEAEVNRLSGIVYNFDMNLSMKATRHDIMTIDNKFRQYVSKEKYKPFVETTELDTHELKGSIIEIRE